MPIEGAGTERDPATQVWSATTPLHWPGNREQNGHNRESAVLDAYSRRIIGWFIAERQTPELVTDALGIGTAGQVTA